MKVHALRLAECGRFQAPVALEGLSGGLDVLVGPNEFGKSTLLRAMRLALTEKFTSRKADVLRPYGGGAPTIEIDLEVLGGRWRLRKRYLAQRAAELRSLDDGRLLRGEDAEAKLAELLGGEQGKGRFPLLWLAQGDAAGSSGIADEARPVLESLLAVEVQTIAGGARARRVLERVRARLGEFVTTHATPRPRGRFEAAQKQLRKLQDEHASWAQKAMAAARQRDRLAVLRTRESELVHPAHVARLQEDLAKARAASAAAIEAASLLATARQARSLAAARFEAAQLEHDALSRATTDHAALTAEIEAASRALEGLEGSIATAREAASGAASAEAGQRERLAATEARLQAARQAARRAELESRRAALEQRLDQVLAVDEHRRQAAAELAAIRATDATVEAARRETAEIDRLEARLSAAAVGITIAYLPGAEGRVSAAGRSLADGERLLAVDPLVIEVAGVGRITIAPGGSEAIFDVQADIKAHREQLAALLAQAGCDSLMALGAAVQRRSALAGTVAEHGARLAGLAPGGLGVLQSEREGLDREVAALPSSDAGATTAGDSVGELEARLSAEREQLATASREAAAAAARLTSSEGERSRLQGVLADRRQRVTALAATLPPEAERAARLAERAEVLSAAEQDLNEAARQIAAWQEKAVPPAETARLAAAVEVAEGALKSRERELATLAAESARIEGELSSLGNDDAEAQAVSLAEAKAAAAEELTRIEDEVAALQLLAAELAAAEEQARERFLAPVTARIQPYLDLLFPQAALTVGGKFSLEALARGGAPEPVDRLSDGTREQIAVLSRLAFAKLLSDGGRAVPLVLDDPLVYADDTRIAAMFRALELAGASHQVIVLTCHARTFAGLGGNRVALSSWSLS